MPIKQKYDRAEVMRLKSEGKNIKEIADWTGYKAATITYIIKDEQRKAKAAKPAKAEVVPLETPTLQQVKKSGLEEALLRDNYSLREENKHLYALVQLLQKRLGVGND